MTLTIYYKGHLIDDNDKIREINFDNNDDLEIEYEGNFGEIANVLDKSEIPHAASVLHRLFEDTLFTVVDDDEEDITFITQNGYAMKFTFTEPDDEEEEEEDEEEKFDEVEPKSAFPVQDNSRTPEKLSPKREETKHVSISKL